MCCAVLSCSVMSDSWQPHVPWLTWLLCPWGFSRQKYWSESPYPPPGDLPNPGIKPRSLALQVDSLLLGHQGRPFSDGESEVTQSCPTLCDPMAMGFSRQEYWSELPFLMATVCSSLKEKIYFACLKLISILCLYFSNR